MTDVEQAGLRLECLKLALAQAKLESRGQDLDRVAEIQTRFYDGITSASKPATAKGRKSESSVDKTPEIFG